MKNLVLSLMQELCCSPAGCKYDFGDGVMVINEAGTLNTIDALKHINSRLEEMYSGCCYNWAGSLAYRLTELGHRICIVTSPEADGLKVSLAYVDSGEVLICDIVEYVKGACSLIDCVAIPYNDFKSQVGEVWLHEISRMSDVNYNKEISEHSSNISLDEFIKIASMKGNDIHG